MLLLFFEYGVEFLIEFGSFMLVFQRCLSISLWARDYTLVLRKKGACSRQVPFCIIKDAPERRTLPIFPDQRSITLWSIDTATGKEAPADISSERVKDIFHHREKSTSASTPCRASAPTSCGWPA